MRMSQQEIAEALNLLQGRVEPVERFIAAFEESLPKPIFCDFGGTHAGYRYGTPDKRHFCLLKLVRATTALNAMIGLARLGFTQEIAVLVRIVTECTTQIEFVLSDLKENGEPSQQAEQLVKDYFEDFARGDVSDHKKSSVNQSTVHRRLGANQDRAVATTEGAERFEGVETALLYQRISRSFSAYVHCKYPETMDLCGGPGPKFHLRGMSGTPKDYENVQTVATFLETLILTTRSIILRLALFETIQKDRVLFQWYREESKVRWQAAG